jgi:2-polyprenyl-6-methoxyphenol hydroxylase-like FAD-dependent oxidoreductase
MRMRVAIVAQAPAGLVLPHPLAARGIQPVVVEHRSREYVEARVRGDAAHTVAPTGAKGMNPGRDWRAEHV